MNASEMKRLKKMGGKRLKKKIKGERGRSAGGGDLLRIGVGVRGLEGSSTVCD